MLIYSMSVSVDGFIGDRDDAFDWSGPSDEQFRFQACCCDPGVSVMSGAVGKVLDRRRADSVSGCRPVGV